MGTPEYMAHEQMKGMNVDHRADIYSLGVMIYEMLCREVPRGIFQAPSARTGCDTRIDGIVIKAMQQAPDHRYQSTQEMETDVQAARTPLVVPPPVAAELPKSPARSLAPVPQPATISHTPLYAGIAGAAVAAICGAIYFTKSKPNERTKNPSAVTLSPSWQKVALPDAETLLMSRSSVDAAGELPGELHVSGRLMIARNPRAQSRTPRRNPAATRRRG